MRGERGGEREREREREKKAKEKEKKMKVCIILRGIGMRILLDYFREMIKLKEEQQGRLAEIQTSLMTIRQLADRSVKGNTHFFTLTC